MKNTIKLFGFIALVAIIGLAMAACGGDRLSGTYADDTGIISFTFSGNKLTVEAFGQKAEGTYKTSDGKLITTSPDGKTETYEYILDGNNLTINQHGMKYTLTKK